MYRLCIQEDVARAAPERGDTGGWRGQRIFRMGLSGPKGNQGLVAHQGPHRTSRDCLRRRKDDDGAGAGAS